MALYEVALVGSPSNDQIIELESRISGLIRPFGMRLGAEVGWYVRPSEIFIGQRTPGVGVFFGAENASMTAVDSLFRSAIPILPIASSPGKISSDIPEQLRCFNCLTLSGEGMERISSGVLECLGLLPRQRRVFLSYRREEARAIAVQLFDALSARVFDVFLDTHGIAPAEDFQEMLWHRLCDCDVLTMLDTATYFNSRWTAAEFGRALAKGISVLRIGWPGVNPSSRTATASNLELQSSDFTIGGDLLSEEAIARICTTLEIVRAHGHGVRSVNMFSNLKRDVELIGGSVIGVGPHNSVHISLPNGPHVVAYPTLGVPTSVNMNNAIDRAPGQQVALIYDHIGLRPEWLRHLEWLGENIRSARWVKATETAWAFADWVGR